MKTLFCTFLAALAFVASAETITDQLSGAIKTIANDHKLSAPQQKRLVSLFGSRVETDRFIRQLDRFWQNRTARLISIQLRKDKRLQPATWIDVRYRLGAKASSTEYMQQLYLEKVNGLWKVVRFTKIAIAPIALSAPALRRGSFLPKFRVVS